MTLCPLSFDEVLLVQANRPVSYATYMLLYLSHLEGYSRHQRAAKAEAAKRSILLVPLHPALR